ncbi:MAG: hypothetical protein U1F68_21050 [Gammaproteobacteria bacterium]
MTDLPDTTTMTDSEQTALLRSLIAEVARWLISRGAAPDRAVDIVITALEETATTAPDGWIATDWQWICARAWVLAGLPVGEPKPCSMH